MEVLERIKGLLEPIVNERKYYVIETTYKREGRKLVLRIIVDKEGGITMEECATLNNELSEILDKENLIDEEYLLEVSSPGLDRKLKTDSDFTWAIGKKVRVSTYAPIDSKNVFSGTLVGLGEGTVVLDEDGISTEIPREKIASARLQYDLKWDNVE